MENAELGNINCTFPMEFGVPFSKASSFSF